MHVIILEAVDSTCTSHAQNDTQVWNHHAAVLQQRHQAHMQT